MKAASIVIVSYNSLQETTAPCLDSIFRHTQEPEYEVVVVDNHSADETPGFLAETAARERRLRWISSPANLGYAAATNLGIKTAEGECLVLLNSDTQVTPGWLEKTVDYLRKNPGVGLVGPVTNSVGNEQKIFAPGGSVQEIIAAGGAWVQSSAGDTFETERLGFFCVSMRREHVTRVGLLDESFGLGYFEDDDYCVRSRTAGYRLVCMEDVFIYHRGNFSFGQLPRNDTRRLFKENERRFHQKHGRRIRPVASRARQLALARRYLANHDPSARVRMLGKAENRLRLVRSDRPRSPLKRLFYQCRCAVLARSIQRLALQLPPPRR
jgi:GT2 family glycosyltransferase